MRVRVCVWMDGMDGWNGCLGCTERRRKLSPIRLDSGRKLFLILFLFLFFFLVEEAGMVVMSRIWVGVVYGIWYMVELIFRGFLRVV